MAKTPKKRFNFSTTNEFSRGSEGEEVGALQSMLASYGYLTQRYHPGAFDQATELAVRRYQRFYKLKPDGVAGPVTKAHIAQPRCGVSDRPRVSMGATGGEFVLRGCSYQRRELTYAFLNTTPDLTTERQRQIVREAFDAWAAVTNLAFVEIDSNGSADFPIAWHRGTHGDGSPFDENGGPSGNTLAHAFFPPPCGGPNAGAMHFDEAEAWVDDGDANGIRLRQVAIHEIGHLLGLSHSDDEAAIMFALYAPDRVALAPDDIAGIQALYGPPGNFQELVVGGSVSGSLARTGAEAVYTLRSPGPVAVTMDGPGGADFDLYVRRNQAPTQSEWDVRAFTTAADEQVVLPGAPADTYFIMARSFQGSGAYALSAHPLTA